MFAAINPPVSRLGYYRLLAPTAAVRVSPLCFGAMSLGTGWAAGMGSKVEKKESFELLDHYYKQGGNFIDTANNYQNEESEEWIGEWMAARKNRHEMVIATKYTCGYVTYKNKEGINVNYSGNSRKSMMKSVEDSLRKLQTDFIDIFYLHMWDHTTSIEELMQGLNSLVVSGKVLYLGISDAPAWVVSKANQYARDHGFAQFVIYQGRWNLMVRDLERDILPMCRAEGMAIAVWQALGGGLFKSDEEIAKLKESGGEARDTTMFGGYETSRSVSRALDKVAKAKNTSITSVALAYILSKAPNVFPIVGGRKPSHLQGNIDALETVTLTPEEIKELEASSPLDQGFPHNIVGHHPSQAFFLFGHGRCQFSEHPSALPLGGPVEGKASKKE